MSRLIFNRYIILFALALISYSAFAQDPQIEWQNTIGGSFPDQLNSIQQTIDGGYICGGWSWSNISGDKTENGLGSHDYWIIKLDSVGNIQWQNTIGGNSSDILYSIQQTADGGYICGGYSASYIGVDKTAPNQGNFDYWVVKLDSSGIILWDKTIGGIESDYLNAIQQTADGGYICGGCVCHCQIFREIKQKIVKAIMTIG